MKSRLPDWRARLNAFLCEIEDLPLAWGAHDCCIGLMAGSVMATTGKDYARGYRGTYKGPIGATRMLIRRDGVNTPADLMAKWFGEMKPQAFARTGDLVLFEGCIGVMHGCDGLFIGCEMIGDRYTREGLVRVPRAELEGCWHV